jgi:hypothetical protein
MLSKFYLVLGSGLLGLYALTCALGWETWDPVQRREAAISALSSGGHGGSSTSHYGSSHSSGFGGGK